MTDPLAATAQIDATLAGLCGRASSPASVSRVRAFYKNWSPLELSELQALSDVGKDLLKDR